MERLILGTAGHIDHGKTTLVRALTGVDTDRLPEEKQRGITIDLGFAALDLADGTHFGIVDVPGHEGFVRNMLAGASGVDVGLLVVAADEGVMPQTREHVAILALLGVRTLVVALTKADLVDDDWRGLATDDVRELLAQSPWPDAPVLPVSGVTGAGLDALRAALATAAHGARIRAREDLFRMPVDRVFTVHGTGTVVTGTVWSGSVRRDDQLHQLPRNANVRVRTVQSHGARAEQAGAGERAALALASIDRDDIRRGDTLVTGTGWAAALCLTVRIAVLADAVRPVRARQRVRVHLGTAEVMARIALPGRDEVAPGDVAWAQLRLESPLVARARDRLIVRSYSPITTIAGGVVVEPDAPRRRRFGAALEGLFGQLIGDAPVAPASLAALASLEPWQGAARPSLCVRTGLTPDAVAAALTSAADIVVTSTRIFAADSLVRAMHILVDAMDGWHAGAPLEAGCDRDTLRRALPKDAHPELLLAALERLVANGRIHALGALYARAGWEPVVSAHHAALLDAARDAYARAGLESPAASELPAPLAGHSDCAALLRLLERNGELVALEPGRYVGATALQQAVDTAQAALAGRGDLGPADFREVWGVSRKHLIPLLEYLDRSGVTERVGDVRRWGTGPREDAGAQVRH